MQLWLKSWKMLMVAVVVSLSLLGGHARAGTLEYPPVGKPIDLVVGHPCCYAAIWSAYIANEKQIWKKYLPAGSTVKFEVALAGPPILNAMFAGKQQVGYLGDMPAIIATTKREVADIRLVATPAISYDQCNILLVRADAPKFEKAEEAVRWLNDKQVAAPRGTCSDAFAQNIFKRENVKPAAYLNQTIEVITSAFRAGKLDGAGIWEPVASQIVNQKLARRGASGATYKLTDAAFLTMRNDLIEARPDVAMGWVETELEAEQFIADPKNKEEVVAIVHKYVPGFTPDDLRAAIYGKYPTNEGGSPVRIIQTFSFPQDVRTLLAEDIKFLHSIKGSPVDTLPADAIVDKFAEEALKKHGLKSPIGQLVGN